MFNANYAYTNAYYPKAFYAQPRGGFRRGGYTGNFGERNYNFGRGNAIQYQRMNNGNLSSGFSIGQPFSQNNHFVCQSPRNLSPFIISGFTGVNSS